MNNRERILACLNYQPFDRLPVVHFGFWGETWKKWERNGEMTAECRDLYYAKRTSAELAKYLGFDCGYADDTLLNPDIGLAPPFERKVLRKHPDGSYDVLNPQGVVVRGCEGVVSIPAEVDHLLKDRASWEKEYLPRLQFHPDRVNRRPAGGESAGKIPFADAVEKLRKAPKDCLYGLHCGSLIGVMRNYLGVENLAYLQVDDEELFNEIVATIANLCFKCVKTALAAGVKFDYAHFWEDICFKNGPLISPRVFAERIGPHYKRITDLLLEHGIELVSLDCDGMIDALIPTWLENGVNTMFPIEVGTWNASIKPWRERYGRALRGVGGMNKTVFALDRQAVDAEIERLKPLVALGGYLPCPDHRIPPDAKFGLVQYYCQRMQEEF